ncbi:MAG: TlpA disulfide reductase family protein [Bacteroidetes bacterium]|nr:TlpA disulfide reductase family protein [Bacteroidota bacterium]
MRTLLFLLLSLIQLTRSYGQSPAQDDILARFEQFRNKMLNKPLPHFELKGLDSTVWESAQQTGKIIVINCWFTTCKPCIQEMPELNDLVEANKNKYVLFLAPAPEDGALIRKFLTKYTFHYIILTSALDYFNNAGIENFPTHLVVDKTGIVREVFIGFAINIREKLQVVIDEWLDK